MLFIRPLQNIKFNLGSPTSVAMLLGMKRTIQKNRNLLLFTVLCTLLIIINCAVWELDMRTCIWLCAIDRLVTLQCITMTFTYDKTECYYCYACLVLCLKPMAKGEQCNLSYDAETSIRPLQSVTIGDLAPNNSGTAEDANTASYSTSVHFHDTIPKANEFLK